MQWFTNLSIKAKLIMLAVALSIMLGVTGGMGYFGVNASRQAIAGI